MSNADSYDSLRNHLAERGHTEDEIRKIVARVRQYDAAARHDSVMDSIDRGAFDLEAIIADALGGNRSGE